VSFLHADKTASKQLGRLRQEDGKFEVGLYNIARPPLKKRKLLKTVCKLSFVSSVA
jgi:hypothetical protein